MTMRLSAIPRAVAGLPRAVADAVEEHPEGGVFVLAAVAWASMLPHALSAPLTCHTASFADDWGAWMRMVLAMMLPLMAGSVRWTAERSFRSRQGRAMAGYVLGYLAPWAALGGVVAWLLGQPGVDRSHAALVFAIASAWSATPLYTRLVGESHRTIPLAPRGWRADRDCV
ncbi:MAG: DUF2182 domain-containing protein, partial [Myxococcota bacterium]